MLNLCVQIPNQLAKALVPLDDQVEPVAHVLVEHANAASTTPAAPLRITINTLSVNN